MHRFFQFIGSKLIGIVVVRLIILGVVLVFGIQLLGVLVFRFGLLRLVLGVVIKFRGLLR